MQVGYFVGTIYKHMHMHVTTRNFKAKLPKKSWTLCPNLTHTPNFNFSQLDFRICNPFTMWPLNHSGIKQLTEKDACFACALLFYSHSTMRAPRLKLPWILHATSKVQHITALAYPRWRNKHPIEAQHGETNQPCTCNEKDEDLYCNPPACSPNEIILHWPTAFA